MGKRRYPPLIAGVLAFVACILVFQAEGTVFLYYRTKEFENASTGKLLEGNDGDAWCVSYANPSDVHDQFVDGKRNVILGRSNDASANDVKCSEENDRDALGKLAMASIHAIQYSYDTDNGDGTLTDALRHTRAAVMAAFAGSFGEANFTNVVSALSELHEPPTTCEEIYSGASEVEITVEPRDRIAIACYDVSQSTFTVDKNLLYSHCRDQFYFGLYTPERRPWGEAIYDPSVGGSFGIPVYGDLTKPAITVWVDPPGYNDTMPRELRARTLTGMRYGYAIFGSIPVFILASLLLIDCIFFSLVELTVTERLEGVANTADALGGGTRSQLYAMYTVYATTRHSRNERFFFTFFGWIACFLFRAIFVWIPFNFGRILPRPKCIAGSGWEEDHEATNLECLSLGLLLAVIIMLPLSTVIGKDYSTSYRSDTDSQFMKGVVSGSRRTRQFVGVAVAGTLIALVGQALNAITFGEAWAESLGMPAVDGAKYTDANSFADAVYTKTIGAYAISITGGMAIASILARWLFGGVSLCATLLLILWLLIALASIIPILVIDGISLDRADFDKDCDDAFPDDEDRRSRCQLRFWAYITGLVLIFFPLVMMLVYCFFRQSISFCTARARAGVDKSDPAIVDVSKDVIDDNLIQQGLPVSSRASDTLPLLRIKTA